MPALDGLRALRTTRGETQLALAQALGVTRGLIAQYEIGRTAPSIRMAIKLAEHYGVTVERLMSAEPGPGR